MGIKSKTAGILLAAFASVASWNGLAQTLPNTPGQPSATSSAPSPLHANQLHLAYITTPSEAVNSEARNGLDILSEQVNQRTSVMTYGVTRLDVEKDELVFYPFIYWPITANTPPLSAQAQHKVQDYINAGGMIVFDTGYLTGDTGSTLNAILGDVVIKPLVALDRGHTLTKSFYLVSDLKGSRNGTVWVEAPGAQGTDAVSSVIIGDKMWARSWGNLIGYDNSRDDEKNQILRSGINMVIYALTGAYKEDQVHVRPILERLGR